MRRLVRFGYQAFLVGGGVRDLLLGKKPKDFDVGTNASPEEVSALFRNSRVIGRRFRLNHIYFRGNKIIEVSTFRRSSVDDAEAEDNLPEFDNLHGDAQTDAFRRDLTINGLFYDLRSFSVIDYVGGIQDLENGVIRIIGDPKTRFEEDPVRMIRAVRHAARADFKIARTTHKQICDNADLLAGASNVRVYEEFLKDLRDGSSWVAMQLLYETGLLTHLFPTIHQAIEEDRKAVWQHLDLSLRTLDKYSPSAKEEISAAVLFLVLLIGNLPEEVLEDIEDDDESMLKYWEAEDPVEEDLGSEKLIAKLSARLSDVSPPGKLRGRPRKGKLRFSIDVAFGDLTVPRREKEKMEQLLFARYLMLIDDSGENSDLEKRNYFNEAILLLQCTSYSSEQRKAFRLWKRRADEIEKKKKAKSKRRKIDA
jgi:poly(A) polymerase